MGLRGGVIRAGIVKASHLFICSSSLFKNCVDDLKRSLSFSFTQSIYLSILFDVSLLRFSLGHLLDHFTHHGTILEILAVKVLGLVPGAVTRIAHHRHINLLSVRCLSIAAAV